ncbi:hypothetical protein [Natronorubrum thiooxidans]|uniref:Uncharacterized protein n=1 Tax=Natronorubrum thiooxidans TaxID=308853 RepID=A0A1N7C5J6_9EURY|nr:hypothetical protein [Natronorubrum thiooxidans]SIR58859.1 hypothetical protein SAMN05421752_101136 [Natronorubrum thiooxidans]
MVDNLSRRNFIRNSSATALAVGSAGLAGCTSSLPIVGDDASAVAVDEWLVELSFTELFQDDDLNDEYEDATLETHDQTDFTFDSVVPQAVFDNEEELVVYWPLEQGSDLRGKTGVPETDIDWQLSQHVAWEYEFSYTQTTWGGEQTYNNTRTASADIGTLSGSFELETVEENLENWADDRYSSDNDLSSEGEYEAFDLYQIEGQAFAVGDSHVIEASVDSALDPIAVVKAAIDARWNSDGNWAETDDGETLLAQFDAGHLAEGEVHTPRSVDSILEEQYGGSADIPDSRRDDLEEQIEDDLDDWETGLTGTATAHEFDGETTALQEVFLYENEDDADPEALRDHVDSNRNIGNRWATISDYSVSDEGRTLVLTGTVRTRALL